MSKSVKFSQLAETMYNNNLRQYEAIKEQGKQLSALREDFNALKSDVEPVLLGIQEAAALLKKTLKDAKDRKQDKVANGLQHIVEQNNEIITKLKPLLAAKTRTSRASRSAETKKAETKKAETKKAETKKAETKKE